MHQPIDLQKAYCLLNHGPVVLVSSANGDVRNVMSAAWVMSLDFAPPKVAVVIDKSAFSRELIEKSGEFALNIPARRIAEQVLAVGSCSGRDGDKFAASGLRTFSADKIAAPLVEGCIGWLECRLIPEPHTQQAYDLLLGEVVAAHADPRVFDGRWHFADEGSRTLHYIAGGSFFATGEQFSVGEAE